MQYYEIILSKRERRLLKELSKADVPSRVSDHAEMKRLLGLGFAESDFIIQTIGDRQQDRDEMFTITDSGRYYLAYCRAGSRKLFWEWFRYAVTTLIALAALFTAIASIILQRA